MFYEEIRRQAEAAPRAALPAVTAALWRAFGGGHVSEAEAEALSGLIEARQASETRRLAGQSPNPTGTDLSDGTGNPSLSAIAKSRTGSRPRTDASVERRRRWAASGRLPPGLAAQFTLAEQAALAVIAAETTKRGDCRLCHEHVAATAGVSRSTVKAALRQARMLGLLTIEERRLSRYRNDTNIVRIVGGEWTAWLRLSRAGDTARGGGVKFVPRTNTPVSYPVSFGGRRGKRGYRTIASSSTEEALSGVKQSCRKV